jgi:hypothetical protein
MLTPAATEAELRRLAKLLEARTDAFAGLLQKAAESEVAQKVAYAKALLVAEGATVSEREAAALVATEKELRARKIAEAVADAARESIRSIRDEMTAVEAINRNVRFAAGLDSR